MRYNPIKKATKCVLSYIISIIISSGIFIILFHIKSLKITNTFFYNGCIFLAITAVVCAVIMNSFRIFWKYCLEIKDIVCCFFIYVGFTIAWFSLFPVTVERSISVYMLSYLDEKYPANLTKEEFEKIFYKQYILDFGAFNKRFKEQLDTGSIEYLPEKKSYRITKKGKEIVKIFRIFSKMFGTEEKLIYPTKYQSIVDSNSK